MSESNLSRVRKPNLSDFVPSKKRIQPGHVTPTAIKNILLDTLDERCTLEIQEHGGKIFVVKFKAGGRCDEARYICAFKYLYCDDIHNSVVSFKGSMKRYEALLAAGLAFNDTNIWNKSTFIKGITEFDRAIGFQMQKYGPSTIYDDQAILLLSLFQDLSIRKRSMSSGVRCPDFLKEFVKR